MPIVRFFYGFFAAILPNLRKILVAFRDKGSKIPFWTAITDSLFVLRGMWLFLFLNLAGVVFFIFLTQGTDILTAIMEDTRQSYAGTILWLVLGIFFWSVVAEFGARYTMNVSDNSGKTLTDERVEWRKLLQTFYSKFFLFLPSTIMILGFIKAASLNYSFSLSGVLKSWRDVGMTLLIFVVLFITIYHMYVNPNWKRVIKNLFRFLRFSPPDVPEDDERKWQDKLYGIYRDYIFMYPEASIPKDILTPKKQLKTEERESQQDDALLNYPQSNLFPPRIKVLPKFKVIRFERPKDGDIWCRWIYKVPLSFFPRLHRQIAFISLTGIAVILLVSMMPVDVYKNIGSPGLIAFAFAAWLGVYIGLIYLEYANPFRWNPPWRLLLFLWMLYCSANNHDHPIRKKSDDINAADSRPLLKRHFDRWASMHPNDSIVVFVCAEGGALRTGAFSSMILSRIQDRDTSFKDRIFAFSSVSGGSLGIGYFNALAYFNNHRDLMSDPSFYSNKTKDFFSRDHLAPLIGKLFYGDIINLFSPRMISAFDRAGALEKSWELGYERNATFNDNNNVFASDYYSVYNPPDSVWYPAWFINTEEVETGLQGWITNVDARALPLSRNRDILRKVEGTIRYSTAINFSTRFPLFSPGGALDYQLHRYHYVDGGYIENYGAQTMLEVLQELRNDSLFRKYKPYVMVIQFGNDTRLRPSTVTFGNELSEIVTGISNSSIGRGVRAKLDLNNFVTDSLKGKLVDVPLDMSTAKVPMNWILSDTSLRRLDQYCDKLINRNASLKDILQVMKYKRIIPQAPLLLPDITR